MNNKKDCYITIKRFLDIVFSLLFIVLLSPIFLIIVIIMKITTTDHVIFKQKRFGLNKKVFIMYKFRTMTLEAPKDCASRDLKNPHQYTTTIGKFLRKTSFDELPQIFNIFIGDMSFIGPRPVVLNEKDQIEEREKYDANSIKPGLTGWAQVNGREKLNIEQKAACDGYYRKNVSFLLDLKICLKSIFTVLSGKSIDPETPECDSEDLQN